MRLLREAPTRFELVIEVLQTFALPLGYGAIYLLTDYNKSTVFSQLKTIDHELCILNDSDGNRTRVTAVKGRCLDRLTTEP